MAKVHLLKKKLGFLSKTVFIANLLAVVALLLSYSASFINPKTFWPLAFFGLGYLPILLINIGFVGYWLMRKPKHALISFITILIGWNLLTKHWNFSGDHTQEITAADSSIRVLSFNVHLFKTAKKGEEKDFKREVLGIIDSIKPDVICFQEYYSKIKGKHVYAKELRENFGYKYWYFEPASVNDYEAYGQAIFSKYPVIHSGTIVKNEYGINRIIYADIEKGKKSMRIYNVHLRSFALQNEDKDFIQNPSGESNKTATRRVGRKLKQAFASRSEQAEALKEHIETAKIPYMVMGDFNDTPMSYSVNLIGKGMQNAFQKKGSGWGVTHYEMLPIFQIDYIFTSKDFNILNYQIVKRKLSDHYPIWADVQLKD
ncbi:endonuclease/exonuclease/phosphatase family protein [Sphingobacterium spiritivorum]|uniref:endonuclease/exonuclease/phosphatase family protein n=1 Tax=Sphingobacterium spiritivorum TaxID=258 RepID=UPI003DA32502